MRRIAAFGLAVVMFLSLASCGTGGKTSQSAVDDELARAVSYGIVSEDKLTDMDKTVTYSRFCELLTRIVSMRGEEFVPEWEALASDALLADEPMQRDDALLAMFEASIIMGIDREETVQPDWEEKSTAEDWWHGLSRDYPLFPNWQEPYAGTYDGSTEYNIMEHSAWHFEKTPSVVSGLLPFEPEEDMTYGFDKDVSYEEAVRALTRLTESNAKITADDPVYIPVTEAGGYDTSIITDQLLSADSPLPEVSQNELPSDWKGAGLSCCKDGHHIYRHFRESDVTFLAENGFNFLRLFFGFDTLRFPDYPEDGRLINENELKELDQLIAWGMEHGVHIHISMGFYLDENGNCKQDDSSNMMPENDAEWSIVSDYWTMLARRYKGIPSKYLTFDLSNEIQPSGDDFDYQAENFGEMVSAIRSEDSERVLLHSFAGEPDSAWLDYTASLGIAVGCHPYYPINIATGDTGAGSGSYFEPGWPMPVLPAWQISTLNAPLTLQGEISGASLSIHVGKSGPNAQLEVLADGVSIQTLDMPEALWEENGECWYGEDMLNVQLPEGTTEVQLWVRSEDAHIDTVIVEGPAGRTSVVFSSDAPDDPEPLPVVINKDGSYSNTDNTVITGEDIYNKAIKPYQDTAQKYGVGFMIGEFGSFAGADWDINVVAAYQDTMLELFKEKGLGWCYCELYNAGTHLLIRETSQSQWSNATLIDAGLDASDGPCMAVKEMLDVFHKYTLA